MGAQGGPGPFTHRVRIFGMWLKLVTRMRLMLLLLRVLQRPGKTEMVSREQPEGHQEPMRSASGRDDVTARGTTPRQPWASGWSSWDKWAGLLGEPDSCCPCLPSQYLCTHRKQ